MVDLLFVSSTDMPTLLRQSAQVYRADRKTSMPLLMVSSVSGVVCVW